MVQGSQVRTSWQKKFSDGSGILFFMPVVLYLIFFVAYPIFYNVIMSFQDVSVLTILRANRPFVGLQNYIEIFNDPITFSSITNTFVFTISCIVFQFAIGFALALLFAKRFPLNKFYRGLLMIAWMVPMLIVATLGKWFFAGDQSGLVNVLLRNIGILNEPYSFLTNTNSAMIALICVNIWKGIPFNMLLMATALTTMPEEIFEAASVDGASAMQKFVHITLPLLRPSILVVITQGFIFTFKAFELIYVMTGGGPVHTTDILATAAYRLTFVSFNFGTGAATSNILFFFLLVIGILYLKLIANDEVIS